MKSLKSLFKPSDRNKGSLPGATSSHPEIRLGPAQLLDEHRKQERDTSSDLSREHSSPARPARPSAPLSDESLTEPSSRPSFQHATSSNEDRSVGATGYAARSLSLSESRDEALGNDYRAYMGAVSPGSVKSKASTDADFFSLGSDSRLRTGDSEMKHNEDIADRNIDRYGSNTSPHISLESHTPDSKVAQNHNARRESTAASIASMGSPSAQSVTGSSWSIKQKYSLGTGIATEGRLVDGILPHAEKPHAQPHDRKNWPTRIARDDTHHSPNQNRREADESDNLNGKERDRTMGLREAIMAGPGGYDLKAALDGVVDLTDTEDTDRDVQWASAVTHEVVKPHQHEIIEERIYREIHNHDVYHYIQPVYQTEILPARHFVYDTNNNLVEVSADQLPECTGAKQRWAVVGGDREKPTSHAVRSAPLRREPKILSDKTYITPEGYERRETTILHPPELEELSNYGGPVVPIEFLHHPEPISEGERKEEEGTEHLSNGRGFTVDGLANALPVQRPRSSSSASSRAYTGSSASSRASNRLSIRRKPVPAAPSY